MPPVTMLLKHTPSPCPAQGDSASNRGRVKSPMGRDACATEQTWVLAWLGVTSEINWSLQHEHAHLILSVINKDNTLPPSTPSYSRSPHKTT